MIDHIRIEKIGGDSIIFVVIQVEQETVMTRPIQYQFPNKGQDRFLKPQANLQNNPYAPTYNPGWTNHLNFSYKNQESTPPPGFQAPQEKKSDLEDLIRSYITSNERKWNDHEAFTKEQDRKSTRLNSSHRP